MSARAACRCSVMMGSISVAADVAQVCSDKQNKLNRNRFERFRANSCSYID